MQGLLNAARGFDASRGATFRTYAAQCIRHAMWQGLKQRNRSQDVRSIDAMHAAGSALSDQIQSDGPGPEHAVDVKDQVEHLLKHLPPKLRLVAEGLLGGLTARQIARQLGIASSTVFQRMNAIRQVAVGLGLRHD